MSSPPPFALVFIGAHDGAPDEAVGVLSHHRSLAAALTLACDMLAGAAMPVGSVRVADRRCHRPQVAAWVLADRSTGRVALCLPYACTHSLAPSMAACTQPGCSGVKHAAAASVLPHPVFAEAVRVLMAAPDAPRPLVAHAVESLRAAATYGDEVVAQWAARVVAGTDPAEALDTAVASSGQPDRVSEEPYNGA